MIHMYDALAAVAVDVVRAEIAVQNVPMRMQYQAEMPAERMEAHLLDHVERMVAVAGAAFDDRVLDVAFGVQQLVVAQVFRQLGCSME